ncbi:MAG: 30S ribosomal protein S20 [Candidatus Sumerlaeota bacterium]|nr:30S ribosomal protein S20 [Candidatus Sumerlaeota bacterium]
MPNVKSAEKRVRTNAKSAVRNRATRSALRTATRRVDEALESKDASKIDATSRIAVSTISKTAGKGVIHWKKAARLQSRLRKRINRAQKATAQPAAPQPAQAEKTIVSS